MTERPQPTAAQAKLAIVRKLSAYADSLEAELSARTATDVQLVHVRDELRALRALLADLPASHEPWPEPEPSPEPDARERMVFIHEMMQMPPRGGGTSTADIVARMRRAAAALGPHCWNLFALENRQNNGQALNTALMYYEAARQVPGVWCAPSLGYVLPGDEAAAREVVKAVIAHPRQYMRGKRPYVTAYHAADAMREILAGLNCHYVPFKFARGPRGEEVGDPTPAQLAAVFSILAPYAEGLASFYPSDNWLAMQQQYLAQLEAYPGMEYRMSISPRHEPRIGHSRNDSVFEGFGLEELAKQWLFAISNRNRVTDVELVTGNDESEGTTFLGFFDPAYEQRSHWNSQDWPVLLARDGNASFSGWYAEWFRTGVKPPIERPRAWVTYRRVGKDAPDSLPIPNGKPGQAAKFVDHIYVTIRTHVPAEIEVNGERRTVSAGEHHVRFPWAVGPVVVEWRGQRHELLPITNNPVDGAWKSFCIELP